MVGICRIPNPVRAGPQKACAVCSSCRIYSWKAPSGPRWRIWDSTPWHARPFPRSARRPLAARRRRLSIVVCQLLGPGLVPRDMTFFTGRSFAQCETSRCVPIANLAYRSTRNRRAGRPLGVPCHSNTAGAGPGSPCVHKAPRL